MPSGAMPLRHVERLERKQYEWAMANLELAIFNAKKAGLKLKEIAYEIGVGAVEEGFHFGELTVGEVKRYLAERGVPVRLSPLPGAG